MNLPSPTRLEIPGERNISFDVTYGQAAGRDESIPFRIDWYPRQATVSLFGLFLPLFASGMTRPDASLDPEMASWHEAARTILPPDRAATAAALRIMAIEISAGISDNCLPGNVILAARYQLAKLIAGAGHVVLTAEVFKVIRQRPLQLSVMDEVEAGAWGESYRSDAGLIRIASTRPIPGTGYSAPAVYGAFIEAGNPT